jgi:hypothetical protein
MWTGSASFGQVESLNPNPLQPAGIGGSGSIGTYHSGSGILPGAERGTRRAPGFPAAPPEQRLYRGAAPRTGEDHTLYFTKRGAYEDLIYHPRRGSYRSGIRTMRTSNYRAGNYRAGNYRAGNYRAAN